MLYASHSTKNVTRITIFWLHNESYPYSGCCWCSTVFLCPQSFLLKAAVTLCLRAFSGLRRMLSVVQGRCEVPELTPLEQLSIMNGGWQTHAQAPCLLAGTPLMNALLHLPEVPRGTECELSTVVTCSLTCFTAASFHLCSLPYCPTSAYNCHLPSKLLALESKPKLKWFLFWQKRKLRLTQVK